MKWLRCRSSLFAIVGLLVMLSINPSTTLAASASLYRPLGIAVDSAGNVYIADYGTDLIRKLDPTGIVTTVAGNESSGYSGDGGPATLASLNSPYDVAVDGAGNLYIADSGNNRVRKVDATGIITTVAGNGIAGYSGDGGPATVASLSNPSGVAVDNAGNIYISDFSYRVRRVDVTGIITTVAGNGIRGHSEDGGLATEASLVWPTGVAVDGAGNFYIADYSDSRIRKVDATGIITTVAGNGDPGYSGDGGPATLASVYKPFDVAVDNAGNLYIADNGDHRIRKVDTTGIITTVAGNGIRGYSGDGGPATQANIFGPCGVVPDGAGNLYISDTVNDAIREVDSAGIITTAVGSPPFVSNTDPANGAIDVPRNQVITVTFSEIIQVVPPESNIVLYDEKRMHPVDRTVSVADKVLTITPLGDLIKNTTYSVTIPNFSIRTPGGIEMGNDYTFYFITLKQ